MPKFAQRLQHPAAVDAERTGHLQADAFAARNQTLKTHAEVARRKRCAGVAGPSSSLLCRVPDMEHFNSARLFSPDASLQARRKEKSRSFTTRANFDRANIDAVTSLRI
jgi:hypothetical protein